MSVPDEAAALYAEHVRRGLAEERDSLAGAGLGLVVLVTAAGFGMWARIEWLGVVGIIGAALCLLYLVFGGLWHMVARLKSLPERFPVLYADGVPVPVLPDMASFVFFAERERAAAVLVGSLDLEEFAKRAISRTAKLRCSGCAAPWQGAADHLCACGKGAAAVHFPRASAAGAKRVGLRNRGSKPLELRVRCEPGWLSARPEALALAPGASGELSVELDRERWSAKSSEGWIRIASGEKTLAVIEVQVGGSA